MNTSASACPGKNLAELVSTYVWDHHRQRVEIDANYISKLERGTIRWPNARYREGFRAILNAAADHDLGFFNPRRVASPLKRAAGAGTIETVAATATATSRPELTRRTVPRQLPPPTRLFTGRTSELDTLSAALDTRSETTESMVTIWAIGGVGGIGKTLLALNWAHRNSGQFPDGQLFVNLRGFAPIAAPVPAAVALRWFLDGLGVDPHAIPADVNSQIGLYRSLVADK